MSKVRLEKNTVRVKDALADAAIAFLHEACGEIVSQTKRNSRVKTTHTRESFEYTVDDQGVELVGRVGSPLENAVWEEFGTGEYALGGNGRKGGWAYTDAYGKTHYTRGKKPSRALFNAFKTCEPKIKKRAEAQFRRLDK